MKRYLVLLFFVLVGCASLPVIKSQPAGENPYDGSYYFDLESNIAYRVTHDEEYLYLKLKTDDETAIRKIMMQGLYIYMDPKGAKSKDIFFNYPLSKKFDPSKPRQKPTGMTGGYKQEFDVNNLLDRVSMEAVFSNHEIAEKLPVYSSKTDFKVELSSEGSNVLLYYLRIPFDRITENGLSDMSELSLGLMTGKMEIPQMGDGGHQGGGGMQGGGKSVDGMQGGGRPSGSDMQGGGVDRESMMSQLSIWFKIDLSSGME